MASLRATLRRALDAGLYPWVRNTIGQDLIEYVLLASFISVGVLAAASGLGTSLDGWFKAVATVVVGASPAAGAGSGDGGTEAGGDSGGAGGGSKSNCGAQGQASSGGHCL